MTTPKIYLHARPSNEGAHRLVWLLCDHDARARVQLHRHGISDMMIHRLVTGDVTPGMEVGTAIHIVSEGAITAKHWNSPALVGWFDRPGGWPMFGASADAERLAA